MEPKDKLYAAAIKRRTKTILDVPEARRWAVMALLSGADRKRAEAMLGGDDA